MSQTLEDRITFLETENAMLYAEKEITKVIGEGVKVKDKDKEIAKLAKMTPEQRKDHLADIRLNYAREDRKPVGRNFLPIDDGKHVEGAEMPEREESPSANEILCYAEENKIDITTEAGLLKAAKGIKAEKKAS